MKITKVIINKTESDSTIETLLHNEVKSILNREDYDNIDVIELEHTEIFYLNINERKTKQLIDLFNKYDVLVSKESIHPTDDVFGMSLYLEKILEPIQTSCTYELVCLN